MSGVNQYLLVNIRSDPGVLYTYN